MFANFEMFQTLWTTTLFRSDPFSLQKEEENTTTWLSKVSQVKVLLYCALLCNQGSN